MSYLSALSSPSAQGSVEQRVADYLSQHENKGLLRFITCGSVDDGKSTLIGRLLHDTQALYDDQLQAVNEQSRRSGTQGERVDLALLVDGLQAEREQGITIDVAYRYFSTDKRKFIIADTPGHEQYTRNMATGASTADLAVILVDARYGVLEQTRRHSFIVSLLGIKQVVVAINKMDLKGYSQEVFESIRGDYQVLADKLDFERIDYLPLSALEGDNVASASENTPWHDGTTLLSLLESAELDSNDAEKPLRFPVQLVQRPNLDFRGFAGTIASGLVSVGDELLALPSGKTAKVSGIQNFDGQLNQAQAGQAVTLVLDTEIDLSRGDWLVAADQAPTLSQAFKANLVWMAETELKASDEYRLKLASGSYRVRIRGINHQNDIHTWSKSDTEVLALNGIGEVEFEADRPLPIDDYRQLRQTGAFILIDPISNGTVAAGMMVAAIEAKQDTAPQGAFSQFELELNGLIRKHFPHWQVKDLSELTSIISKGKPGSA